VTDFTIDELMCVCIARQVEDGDVLAQGLATPLVAAGYLLAWRTHAPGAYFASAIGQTVCREGAPLGLAGVESLWLDRAMNAFGFVAAVLDLLPTVQPKEFFRPGQVDAHGNFDNLAIGRDLQHPRLRLPGVGGIPDVTSYAHGTYLYVPRHTRVTFVHRLDRVSGLGHSAARRSGGGARYLVSDLGQFDFEQGRMRLMSAHPGVDFDHIQAHTGFDIEPPQNRRETDPPTSEELDLLRNEIDPLGVRRLEFLGGRARRDALREILAAEADAAG
jgi:acyl CoA:acetate/3-ketoacid CoA transferase beta subunit